MTISANEANKGKQDEKEIRKEKKERRQEKEKEKIKRKEKQHFPWTVHAIYLYIPT